MAASRSRRNFAGTKMAGLLDKEEEDDFYKTTYGGFMEEADDRDFNYNVSVLLFLAAKLLLNYTP